MEKQIFQETNDEIQSIVGDTNLFFQDDDGEEGDESELSGAAAEIEVMIAEKTARRKGLAKEALEIMIKFGFNELKKRKFIAKIKSDNNASLDLFSKLGFIKVSESQVFQEITFELNKNK